MATLTVPEFRIQTDNGDEGSLAVNSHADVILNNPARNASGRALVAAQGNSLVINYDNDFKGGVTIIGLKMQLTPPPAGVKTDFVRIDSEGNLYRLD